MTKIQRIAEFSRLLFSHYPIILKIGFASDDELADVLTGVSVDFAQPNLQALKRFPACNVVAHYDPLGAAIVRRRDSPESLLACTSFDRKTITRCKITVLTCFKRWISQANRQCPKVVV
eukprot:TRINITY_DN1750_c0_g1_i1.p1 TRINITY_DN1750_c0_g1~~TRINITY_DN1750_c0_g1_i1.p1  ORF type:complete len:119 (+),score=0.99 TRINITY_DN1750_c0_g1_i1:375-731(+)